MIAAALASCDPWLIFWVLIAGLIFGMVLTSLSNGLVAALQWIDERDQGQRAADAALFDEPTREQVEADWLTEWWPWNGEPDCRDTVRVAAVEFAAPVFADIDDLPEVPA